MSDMIPEGNAQNGTIPQEITGEEAQALAMAAGHMGWNRTETPESAPAQQGNVDTSSAIDAILATKDTKKSDLYEPLYEGAPEGVYKPAAYESFFKSVIQSAPDPEVAEARLNGAYMLAQVEGLPFEEAFQNYDALIQSYYQKALSPKDALSAIKTTYRTAKLGTQLADLAYQLGQSGGENEEILKEMDRLKAFMPAPDEMKRNLPTEFVKAAAQFAPSMIESLKAGAYGGSQAVTIAAPSIAAGVLSGAIATEGIGAVSLPALLFGIYRAGAAGGTAKRTYELETGSCYYDLLETTQTRVGPDGKEIVERVDPKIAWQFAQVYGALAAATEALPADQALVSVAKSFGLKDAIEATKTVQNTAAREEIVKGLFREFVAKTKSEGGEKLVNVATESAQEVIQQALQLSAEEIAKQITNTEQGTKLDPITREEYRKQITDTLVQSLAGMSTFAGATGAVSLIKNTATGSAKGVKAAKAAQILAGEEVDTPFNKMTDEDVAAFHSQATSGKLPEGVYLTRTTIVEGSEYAYNAVDPATKKPVGSLRFEFVPWGGEGEAPGVMHILGLKSGASPRVNYELMKAAVNSFAGWDIEFDPKTQSQAALKAVMAAENPRGETFGMNWYTTDRQAEKATVQGVVDKIAKYAPAWSKDELDVVAWTMNKWAKLAGTTGDKLADGIFAPGIVTTRTMKMDGREINVGNVIDGAAASQGTAGAATFQYVGKAIKTLIEMGPGSNPSTALHEISHGVIRFMQEVRNGALEFEGKDRIVSELAAIEKAWGVVNGAWDEQSTAWTGEGAPTNKSHWEAFTYAMEDYLMTGKAPRPELESIFARFAQWIRAIYQGIKGARVKINPEMTAFFDRLFGSEESPVTEAELTPKKGEDVIPVQEEAPLEIFQGQTEDRAGRTAALARAKKLAAEGKNDDEIEKATGWRNRHGTWESPRSKQYTREAPEAKSERTTPANGATPKPLYQGAKWVYKAEEAIQKKPWGKMAGRQILSMLKGAGVKQEELTWTGLEEYLDNDEKRTPAEIQAFLAANKLAIKEETKGALKINKQSKYYVPELKKAIENVGDTPEEVTLTIENDGDVYRALMKKFPELAEEDNWAETVVQDVFGTNTNETKYSQYTLSGGENYREVLFMLPPDIKKITPYSKWLEERKAWSTEPPNEGEYKRVLPGVEVFISKHWNEKNVLAHTRLADHTIAGKSTLLVEEIQSDWHQAGRDKGYKLDATSEEKLVAERITKIKTRLKEIENEQNANATKKYATEAERDRDSERLLNEYDRLENELSETKAAQDIGRVPDAPFKKTWHEFVFKRLMHEAADKNYETMAWTSGKQQADRYALAKTIDVIGYTLRGDKLANVTVWGKNGETIYTNHSATREDLDGVIGKEMTNRIFAGEGRKDGKATYLEGINLETGGEGMKSFYDRDLVNYANKILKPFGVQVQDAFLDTAPRGEGMVHTVEITPDVRAHVLTQGFTLFQNGRGTESAERNNLFSTDVSEKDRAEMENSAVLYQGEYLGDPIATPKGSVITAINELRTRKAGIVEEAVTREPIGDIAIPWGWEGDATRGNDNGWGLAKILKKHDKRDNVVANLERVLKEGAIYQDPEHAERVWILHGPSRAVVATYRGYGTDRVYGPWLMTAYTHELSRGTGKPFIPAGATLIAEGTEQKQEKRKVVVKRRNVLYQGGRQVAEIEYSFPSTLKGFSDIHSQGQLPAEIQVFGRGVVDPKTGAVSIGPVGSSHAQLSAGITDAKRFYFGYNRAEEKAYIVAKNSLDENVVYDPKNTKMILSAVFDKYKLGVKPGAKYALKSRPTLYQGDTESQAFKDWFKDSRVVDADGRPLVVYHGTNEDGLDGGAFDPGTLGAVTKSKSAKAGFFFVDNEDTAAGYSDLANDKPVADLIEASQRYERIGKWDKAQEFMEKAEKLEAEGPRPKNVIKAYLSIQNPYVYDAEEQRFLDVEDDIHDAIAKAKKGGHDGVILKNLIDNADWGSDRVANHYIAFAPEQIKDVNNTGAWSREDPRILFQNAQEQVSPNLVAIHNINAEKLLHAASLGGLAMPSLAIINKNIPMESFGDITLIAPKEMVDPQESKTTKVYNADVYSPRYPVASNEIDHNRLAAVVDKLYPDIAKAYETSRNKYYREAIPTKARIISGIESEIEHRDAAVYFRPVTVAFFKDIGISNDPDLDASLNGKEGEFLKWWEKTFSGVIKRRRIFKGFTNAGSRRYADYTLENIFKAMKAEGVRGGENFNFGLPSIRAAIAKQFKSIAQIKKDEKYLVSDAHFEEAKKETNTLFDQVLAEIVETNKRDAGSFTVTENAVSCIIDGIKRHNIAAELKEYGFNPKADTLEKLNLLLSKLYEMPTEYFEAKLVRTVSLSEFAGAIVPVGTSPAVKNILEESGIETKEYEGGAAGRAAALTALAQKLDRGTILFQNGIDAYRQEIAETVDDMTAEHPEAKGADIAIAIGATLSNAGASILEAGEQDGAARVIARAGARAWDITVPLDDPEAVSIIPTSPRVLYQENAWHGSAADFTAFSTDKIGTGEGTSKFGWGIYLSGSEAIGRYYANDVALKIAELTPWAIGGKPFAALDEAIQKAVTEQLAFFKDIGIDADPAEIAKAIRETGAEGAEDAAKAMESGDNTVPVLAGKRKLYQVIIDKDTTLLDWEKPMTKQSPAVRACLAKLGIAIPDHEEMKARAERGESIVGPGQTQNAWMTWGEYYTAWTQSTSPQDISLTLRAAGIVGVKYPAGPRSERPDTDQTNYVIFDERAVSVKRKILYQGEGEKQRVEQIQDAGQPDGALAGIYQTAREMAGEGKTWENLMEYVEETKDWIAGGDKIPELEPEKKRAWYKSLWDAANKIADKGDEINTWVKELVEDDHGKLKVFLSTIWADVMVREQEDAGFGYSEEDAATWEEGRAKAAEIRAQLPEPMIAGAINMGAHGGKMSKQFLASLMGIIRANPEEYAAIYGYLMHDEKIGALGADAAARKYDGFADDERMAERMSISERAALKEKIRDERLEREILTGKATDDRIKDYVKKIKSDAEQGKKRIAELEIEVKDAEAQVDESGREIGQSRKRLREAQIELTRTTKRIEKYLDRNATVPASLESRRRILEREQETLKNRLAKAGDWLELDTRMKAAEKRLNGAIRGQAEYRARGENTPHFIIEAISNAQRELDELKTKQAATKEYKNSAQLQTYLAKIEAEAKLKSHLREIEAERKALREYRAYRARLVKSIMKPAGESIFYEYQEAIQKIQDGINPHNLAKRTQESVNLLREELEKNPSLGSEISRTWLKRALSKNLNEMSIEELEQTERRIRDLRSTGRAIAKQNKAERSEMYAIMRAQIGETIMRHPNYVEPEGYKAEQTEGDKLKKRLGFGKYAFMRAQQFFRDLDGGTEGEQYELLIKDRDRYWREEMRMSRERKAAILEGFKTYEVDPADWYNTRVTLKGVGPNGIDKVLRKSDLAACEMAFRDENSRQAVLFGNFFSAKEKEELDEESLMFEGARRFEIIREAIDSNLTDRDLEMIDNVFKKDATENGKRLATVFGAATNKVLEVLADYFPLRRESVTQEPIYDQIAGDLGSRQPGLRKPPKNGFTKSRITISPKHQKPVKLDLLTTWLDSIDAQEHYINTVLYGQKLDSIYLDPFIQEGIRAAKGDAGLKYVMEYITEIKNPNADGYKNQWEQSIRDLRGNLGVAYLAFRSSSVLKQLITSPWPSLPYAGPRLFTEAMKMMVNPVSYIRQAEERSIYLKNRTQDQVFEAIKANADAQGVTGALKKVGEVGMKGLELVDRLCVSVGWTAMYEAELARTGDEQKAIEFADDKTQMTQPSARGVDLAPIYRQSQESLKLLLQFTSSLNVIYNNLRYDVPAAIRNRQWNVAIGTIVGYMIAGVLVNAATNRPNPDDDDETKRQKLMFWALTQGTDSLPLIGQEATRIMQRAVTGEKTITYGEQTLPGIQALCEGMYRVSGGEIDRAMIQFAKGGGMILGLPVSGVKEAARAATGDLGALAGWQKKAEE